MLTDIGPDTVGGFNSTGVPSMLCAVKNKDQSRVLPNVPVPVFAFVVLTATSCATLGHAQSADRVQLGVFETGSVIEVPLERIVPATRLEIVLDGRTVTSPFGVRGETLSLTVPQGLTGVTHDIVVFAVTPTGRERLGTWEFETAEGAWDYFALLQFESGLRAAGDARETHTRGGGRIDFDLDDGRSRGGLSFTLRETPDPTTGDRVDIGDWFIESRLTFAGDTGWMRLGSHYYSADGNLIDEAARRGFSVRLADPAGRYDAALFALQPSQTSSTDNLTGVSDPNDRVSGFLASAFPFGASGLRVTVAGFDGFTHDLPDGGAGAVRGAGLALSGPVGRGADVLLTYDSTEWDSGTGTTRAQAFSAETHMQLLDTGARTLTFGIGYDYIEEGYHSALNPDLIAGTETLSLSLSGFAPSFDWELEAAYGRTNAGAPAGTPEDHLGRLAFGAYYSPDVFTGGFLNGTSFFLAAEMLTTDRIHSPAGSIAPSDNTLWSVSIGMDRFRADHSFALLYSFDRFDDRTGAKLDEDVHRIEGLVSFKPSARFNASLGADVAFHDTANGDHWQAQLQGALSYDLIPDKLSTAVEFGVQDHGDPATPDGAWFGTELAWEVLDNHALVVSADYGRGSKAHALAGGDGWVLGIALRSELALARYR